MKWLVKGMMWMAAVPAVAASLVECKLPVKDFAFVEIRTVNGAASD
jgi:hypothetical protein